MPEDHAILALEYDTKRPRFGWVRARLFDLSRDRYRFALACTVMAVSIVFSMWFIAETYRRDDFGYAGFGWVPFAGHIPLLSLGLRIGTEIGGGALRSGGGARDHLIPGVVIGGVLLLLLSFWLIGTFGLFITSRKRLVLKIALFYLATVVVNSIFTLLAGISSAG